MTSYILPGDFVRWVAIGYEAIEAYMPGERMSVGSIADQLHPISGRSTRTFGGEYSRVGFVKEVR